MVLPFIYRTVKITLETIDDVKPQTQAHRRALGRHDIFDQVRCLIIDDKLPRSKGLPHPGPELSPSAPTDKWISSESAASVTDKTLQD